MEGIEIILVGPQLAENIGAVARVMHNFGLTSLRVVQPRDGWPPNEKAAELAVKGSYILENARLFDDVPAALADINFAIAATVRSRDMDKQSFSAGVAIKKSAEKQAGGMRSAILFGRENNGLSNSEINLCDVIATIPTQNSSLNLAQAVAVFAYEIACLQEISPAERQDLTNKAELQQFMQIMSQALTEKQYFKDESLKQQMLLNITNMFVRAELSSQEVRTLLGIIKALVR